MTLMEYFWKASHQIVMLTPNKPFNEADIEGWGSGFILEYKGRQFFITCDHNLHILKSATIIQYTIKGRFMSR